MRDMVKVPAREPISPGHVEDAIRELSFDKRTAFLKETQKYPCLRRLPELSKLADSIVASWNLEPFALSSRQWHRIPCERQIGLAFFDPKSKALSSELTVVECRNLSIEGISFFHDVPILSREVAITFDLEQEEREFLVVRLAWSRFSEAHVFQSGGRFLYQIDAEVSLSETG
ncbi:hypothetical protein Pan153_05750 [Gimesia panareensis]|uniref:PilZ domain-containing protein n=1 Tax=Gimesia panareensis TaxID=2527978 RepID=A0A518FHY5_9PLAN|nr:hypothetical protein [Gimesia panareensis]QDV15956.1 hypothetical protein Pan153_05750 [Gimesia panareensis]